MQSNVFDRRAKLLQQERAAARSDVDSFDFLKEEVGFRVADRVLDVAKKMEVSVDLGSGRGWVLRHLTSHSVAQVTGIEMSEAMLDQAPVDDPDIAVEKLVMDMDGADLPFTDNSVDLVTSCLALHWVNDLPRLFSEVNRILKPDGVFIGALFGGQTLMELRSSLQLAELERQGGFSPHVSPFVEAEGLSSLLNKNNFTLTTIDTDELRPKYNNIFTLIKDLKGMAENNAALNRKTSLTRETLLAANAIYTDLFGEQWPVEEGSSEVVLPATFQVFYWIGWKPSADQPKALKPQKSDVSLKDLYKLDEIFEKKGLADIADDEKK